MSDATSHLQLPLLQPAQAQKHVTVNEGLLRLDALAQLSVVSATTTVQPGSPTDGSVYILPSGKTGSAWGAMADQAIAYWRDGAWEQITPREGWLAFVKDTDQLQVYTGSVWSQAAGRSALGAVSLGGDTMSGKLTINLNALPAPATAAPVLLQLAEANGVAARFMLDAFGSVPVFQGRRARLRGPSPRSAR